MRLLQPAQVSGEIMNLLDKAKQHVIIVSPYNRIKNWQKLAPYLQRLQQRQLPVEYYVRKEHPRGSNFHEVVAAGFSPIEIEGLHCKLYLNEAVGIVTSMNLLLSSDVQALEIGYVTETAREYEELRAFFLDNIKSRALPASLPDAPAPPRVVTLPILAAAPFFLSEYLFASLQQRPLFAPLAVRGKGWAGALTDAVEVSIALRGYYVQATFTFPYRRRYGIYQHLKKQQPALEQALGHPFYWGWQQRLVRLEIGVREKQPLTDWQQPAAERARQLIEQAAQLIADKAAELPLSERPTTRVSLW